MAWCLINYETLPVPVLYTDVCYLQSILEFTLNTLQMYDTEHLRPWELIIRSLPFQADPHVGDYI
jgi:hypothetical protein